MSAAPLPWEEAAKQSQLTPWDEASGISANPPGVPRPPNPIVDEINRRAGNPMAGFPGGTTGTPAKAGPAALAAGTAGLGLGAGAAIGPAGLMAAGRYALPFALAEGINLGRSALGKFGRLIPPGAEMLPFFAGGGKGEAPQAAEAEEAAPSLTEQMSTPTPPGSATWQRPLPAPELPAPRPSLSEQMESAPPTTSAARPSLSQQMGEQAERRVSQQPYAGPNRRIAPEERRFETAPPLDPERIGIDYRPAEDLGVKVRAQTEATKGPIKRGGAKALKQAEALGQPATSGKLIQAMGGQPVETVTGEREPYVPIGFREGPPAGTMVPQSPEEMQAALDMSLRRAKRGRPIQ